MKFLSLTVENFRQFLGTHTIDFSTGGDRNVTVIWGANGAGKTTLLNAFTWSLYGQFTDDFEQPERLANDAAWESLPPGEDLDVRVELEFEHEDNLYRLSRHSTFRKRADGKRDVVEDGVAKLNFTDERGRNHSTENPNDAVKRMLPERLHQFFFFNGERIEHLVQPSAYEEIGQAIKTVLGLEVVERALRHLPQASKKLEEELRQFGTDEQRDITAEIDRLEDAVASYHEEIDQAKRNIAALEEERERIDTELRQMAGARELQRRRDDLLGAQRRNDQRLDSLGGQLDALIRERGFLAFAGSLLERTREEFAERRTRGEIPTPIKREFINDLLEDKQCICGTPLEDGTDAHKAICDWRARAGLVEVDEAWHALYAEAGSLLESRSALNNELARLLSEREEARQEKRKITEALSEVSAALGDSDAEDIRGLEDARLEKERALGDQHRRLGSYESRLADAERDLAEQRSRLRRAESRSQKAELARKRVTVAQDAIELLQTVFELRTHDVRRDLDERIRAVYNAITYKPYNPVLNEEFQLQLLHGDDTGRPVAKSTGENQILSLSFVGALAALARERYDESKASHGLAAVTGGAGGVFPIVMDAAFGTLDESYRRDVAKGLPELAPQVIVLVSKAQGVGAVEEELRYRVGRMHIIHYLTTKEDVDSERLELGGEQHPYIDYGDDGMERAELISI